MLWKQRIQLKQSPIFHFAIVAKESIFQPVLWVTLPQNNVGQTVTSLKCGTLVFIVVDFSYMRKLAQGIHW